MTQSPITVIDGTETAAVARVEINGALEALATLSSGATAPSTTFSGMFWHDTSTGILKIRSEADDAWINVGYLDQSNNEFKPYVGGTQVDTQSTSTWEAGTSTTEGIVSPAKVKAAIDENVTGLGAGQTWQDLTASRSKSTSYTNNTGKPIFVAITVNCASREKAEFFIDNVSVAISGSDGGETATFSNFYFVIPDGSFYELQDREGAPEIDIWAELR